MRQARLKHRAGLPGVAGPAKKNRELWGGSEAKLVTTEERWHGQAWRIVPRLANRDGSVDCPAGISLPARRALSTRCYEQMFRDAWMKDGGLAYWARALCAFQAGIYFDSVLQVLIRPGSAGRFAGEGSGDTSHPAVVVRWPSGPPVSVWPSPSHTASPVSSSRRRTLVPLLHL